MFSNQIPSISLPVINSFDTSYAAEEIRNHDFEHLLINSDYHTFETEDFKSILFKSLHNSPKEDQLKNFIENFNNMKSLWRPLDFIKEQNGYAHFTVSQIVNYTASGLTHTGPWPMIVGDHVYCLPPFQSLMTYYNESPPSCYTLKKGGTIYAHPMLINKQCVKDLIRDWVSVKIFTEKKVIDDSMTAESIEERDYEEQIDLKSEISKNFPSIKTLLRLQNIYKMKPLGMIIRKQDEYADSNEVKPGDQFVLKWFNN